MTPEKLEDLASLYERELLPVPRTCQDFAAFLRHISTSWQNQQKQPQRDNAYYSAEEVADVLNRTQPGRKIHSIKQIRLLTNFSLKEAKDLIEQAEEKWENR